MLIDQDLDVVQSRPETVTPRLRHVAHQVPQPQTQAPTRQAPPRCQPSLRQEQIDQVGKERKGLGVRTTGRLRSLPLRVPDTQPQPVGTGTEVTFRGDVALQKPCRNVTKVAETIPSPSFKRSWSHHHLRPRGFSCQEERWLQRWKRTRTTRRLRLRIHDWAARSVLGSWVGMRRTFHLSVFLTASRMVLPKILVY